MLTDALTFSANVGRDCARDDGICFRVSPANGDRRSCEGA